MPEIRRRAVSPMPQLVYDELYYPDGSDTARGKYTMFLKKDVLAPRKILGYTFANLDYDIGIKVDIFRESASILAEFYLYSPKKEGPVPGSAFLIPGDTATGEEHEITVNFTGHTITGVEMDVKPLKELAEGDEY